MSHHTQQAAVALLPEIIFSRSLSHIVTTPPPHQAAPETSPGSAAPADAAGRVIWWFTDHKPGHVSQVRGLTNAMRNLGPFELVEIDCRRKPTLPATPRGNLLILGAGQKAHRPMLRAKQQTGGLTAVLMHPVWPTGHRKRGFDLHIIPEHDGVPPADDVILTTGALNPLTADGKHDPQRGVILIGGPAKRYGWDTDQIIERLRGVVERSDDITRWTATSSRRTPADTLKQLPGLHPRVEFTPADQTPRGWVAQELAAASAAWVSEDSVSMIFESLTAGCRVGLLPLPYRPGYGELYLGWGPGHVAKGIIQLQERGLVTPWAEWDQGKPLPSASAPLAEATRVAELVWQRWVGRR